MKGIFCYNCNNYKEGIVKFTIKDRNMDEHRTIFDGDIFTIHLCPECIKKMNIKSEWFNNDLAYDVLSDTYIGEKEIIEVVDNFPIENQEFVLNCENIFHQHKIAREDWIKSQLYKA